MQQLPTPQRRRWVSVLGSIARRLLVAGAAFILGLLIFSRCSPRSSEDWAPSPGQAADTSVGAGTSPSITESPGRGGAGEPGGGGGGGGGSRSTRPPGTNVPPTDTIPPASPDPGVLRPPTTGRASLLEQLEEIAAEELSKGTIAYNAPERMGLRESARVEARITRQLSPQGDFTRGFAGDAPVRVETLPVGTTMKAELISTDMEVTPIGESVKELGSKEPVRWLWEIKPAKAGTAYLYLAVAVLYDRKTLAQSYWTREIEVQVGAAESAGSWLGRNWDKLVAAFPVVAGAIGGVVAFVRARRRRRKRTALRASAAPEASTAATPEAPNGR